MDKRLVAVLAVIGAVIIFFGGRKLMMALKKGASLTGIKPEIWNAIPTMEKVFDDYGITAVITAGTDGKHMKKSYHYEGYALDLRLPSRMDSSVDDVAVTQDLKAALGKFFDVVLESDHIHVEFDNNRYLAANVLPARG